MPLTPAPRNSAHPATVLGVHIEPLIRGRRVAILGDATAPLCELLVQRGARLVHAYDPDPARAAEALARSASARSSYDGGVGRRGEPHASAPKPHYAALEGDLGVRDGAFDVIIIPDLTLFDDPADVLRRARRLVPLSGAVVVASPNPDIKVGLLGRAKGRTALGYYELFDVVSLQFPVVRMIGQAPFVGYTIADFALAGEPTVNIDTSLLEATEQPEWFIAIGSERPVSLDEFAVIELPLGEVSLASGVASENALDGEDRLALIEARARLAVLSTELESARDQRRAEVRDLEARDASAAILSARVVELEAELAAKEARFKETQTRAGDEHVRAERLTHQITDLEEELRRQRDRATKLTKLVDDEKKGRTRAEMELAMIRNKPEIAGAKDRLQELATDLEAARARIAELEATEAGERRSAPAEAEAAAPSPPELAVVAPDVVLVSRVSELEIALTEARRALAEATAKGTDIERRAAEAQRRAADAQQRAEGAQQRADQAQQRVPAVEKLAAEAEQRSAELSRRNEELERRVADLLRAQDEAAQAGAPDLEAAETLLRERGRLIASLQNDLRESERIGRELIEELAVLRDSLEAPPSTPVPSVSPPTIVDREVVQDLRARLSALAARSAKSEADLLAASWRITQLERELADAQAAPPEPSAVAAELEHALSAARAEVAALRRDLGERAARTSAHEDPSRLAVEQSVLLNQLAGEIGAGR